ncbi:MAG: hypothetical protein MJ239_02975 [Bacilli bacterium]|nr:hypothetical protein [Bacilli bacterium]
MKKTVLGFSAVALSMILASCGGGDGTSSSIFSSSSSSSQAKADITNEDLDYGQTTYIDDKGNEQNLNRNQLYKNAGSPHVDNYHDNEHKQKLLVAPMSFMEDPTDPNYIEATDDLLEHVTRTFTGTAEEMAEVGGSISLREFYETSSYGHGAFDVYVLPCWVPYNGTPKQFRSASGGQGGVYASSYVRDWYDAEYKKEGHGALGEDAPTWNSFDTDKDGYIDLMWNIYAYPYTDGLTDFWWAYVTYTSNSPNYSRPAIKTLAFASTRFITKSYGGYDAHTLIHETGHTLGLDDYYDYNSMWAPMGGIDYMDHNLGDQSAYSKFQLGWAKPWVLSEDMLEGGKTAVITLNLASTSGEALLLASPDYNGTAFDEYMMVELMGPYGKLCEQDYMNGYEGTPGYTKAGIRVSHIDARVYGGGKNHDQYYTDADEIGRKATSLRLTNSYGGRSGLKSDGDYFPRFDSDGKEIGKGYMAQAMVVESSVKEMNVTNSHTYSCDNDSLLKKNNRMSFKEGSAWCKTFMPSGTNLWNKAKTTTGWKSATEQTYTIDEDCTINYNLKVLDIVENAQYGATATIQVTLNA